ncbi:hypothetical protein RHGRI_015983 [Rhododendron griersonianum]|uniref:RCC1-like domain-containing protein n=1 Tax=Rhododendron griersonianum TaxID=479676 RepID=A0AAV6JSD7_9ERIC|nr:hypothetical protein RHGRI_015983 [Rhododendron griersonianum]
MAEVEKKVEEEAEKGGELLFCGTTSWDTVGRKKIAGESNLVSPSRLRPLIGRLVIAWLWMLKDVVILGGAMRHDWIVQCVHFDNCLLLDHVLKPYVSVQKGQLGHGDTIQRDRPTVVSELSKHKIIGAGSGRSHTVVVTKDAISFAFGWNKHGQLGSGSMKNEIESSPVRCLVSEVKSAVCGGDFTAWLTSAEGASILTAGLPQYGQLGHGTDNEFNTKDSSVRLAYEGQPRPKALASLAGETIVKVACGTNHTVAVDSNGFVYTWGFGGYGRLVAVSLGFNYATLSLFPFPLSTYLLSFGYRLGHREQKDEWLPRRVDVFTRHNVLPPNAVISAGSVNSSCTAGGGQLYMWGKIKSTGDDWMYPKPLMDLSGWNIRCMDSGGMHHFVGADNSCISWGHAQSGELGYGPAGQKSSAVPKKVEILDGMHVISVACGFAHSMVVIDRTNVGDRLDQVIESSYMLAVGSEEPESKNSVAKRTPKKGAGKTSEDSKKRKKSKEDSSESEDLEEDSGDESEEQVNGKKSQRGGKAGRGRAKSTETKSSGRGRGRPPKEKKIADSDEGTLKSGKRGRGRPKKS